MTTQRLPRIVGWVGVVFALGSGVWAFLAPRSFYDNIATFEPYNRHFLHDIGAFTIGLGAAMLLALVTRWDALRAMTYFGAKVSGALPTVSSRPRNGGRCPPTRARRSPPSTPVVT